MFTQNSYMNSLQPKIVNTLNLSTGGKRGISIQWNAIQQYKRINY